MSLPTVPQSAPGGSLSPTRGLRGGEGKEGRRSSLGKSAPCEGHSEKLLLPTDAQHFLELATLPWSKLVNWEGMFFAKALWVFFLMTTSFKHNG